MIGELVTSYFLICGVEYVYWHVYGFRMIIIGDKIQFQVWVMLMYFFFLLVHSQETEVICYQEKTYK